MLSRLKAYIEEHQLIDEQDSLGIAISGGRDSVTAAHMFNSLKTPFVLVHCNFNLRGDESNEDEHFVSVLAANLEYCNGFFSTRFSTKQFARENKLSVQEAARELRYGYFTDLYRQGIFSKLITAHHKNDDIETLLINLYRGSGINGLAGIPIRREYLIRPLLCFNGDEIQNYTEENNIAYREDSSNAADTYLRNNIRNNIIPEIKKFLPDFSKRLASSISNLKKDADVFNHLLNKEIALISDNQDNSSRIEIPKSSILSYPQPNSILYHLLDRFGFNSSQAKQIAKSLNGQSGKAFASKDWKLIIDRNSIILEKHLETNRNVEIRGIGSYAFGDSQIDISNCDAPEFTEKSNVECVSISNDLFPLQLRHWKEGDRFSPLGMNGSKLMSDFFIDSKIDQLEKNKTPLLCKGNEVLWVVGKRLSEKLKVKPNVTLYRLEYHQ